MTTNRLATLLRVLFALVLPPLPPPFPLVPLLFPELLPVTGSGADDGDVPFGAAVLAPEGAPKENEDTEVVCRRGRADAPNIGAKDGKMGAFRLVGAAGGTAAAPLHTFALAVGMPAGDGGTAPPSGSGGCGGIIPIADVADSDGAGENREETGGGCLYDDSMSAAPSVTGSNPTISCHISCGASGYDSSEW